MNIAFSRRAEALTSSAIREILKVTERPEVISFAGGLPSPASFPVEALARAGERLFAQHAHTALQYGPTEGYAPLREWVAARQGVDPARVVMTTGSQQALDLLGKVLIDPGSAVLVETPTYLGALQAFSLYEPVFRALSSDDDGPLPAALDAAAVGDARFLYAQPNFQNPTGRRMPVARRAALVERARELGLLLVEDDPYGELAYDGTRLPSLLSLNPDGVAHLGSFSKVLSPGLRLGYLIAPPALVRKVVQAKQAADLHTPSLVQVLAHEAVRDGLLDRHLEGVRALYAAQCRAMLDALARHMPAGVRWNRPQGGMFVWLTLPQALDAGELLQRAVARNVAFVPGAAFHAGEPGANTLRLAFVTVPAERIERGVAILGEVLAEALNAVPSGAVAA
ncbi:aminotransferase-like domain-containing protein [Pseudothauera rhizosphaerae]|uniref:PLP-dependent aminotransferase family protein n=1 Tax=Pseudothauera rhizosphaerae TaxID=2565932 RepID=A0A4S4AKE4_9RHOO|nr:PLP-dependent aminotransferase family protein [Pseudothauera rhizosphaerae]THF59384.1 PLP-dependent aminotransferase family protein [Pseudothauera rhizosphaerae]